MAHGSSSVFNKLRLQEVLCDAIIRVQNEDFHIHKIILAGCCEYFRTLFTRWSHPVDQVYEIYDVSPDIMRLIIDFAYIGSEEVNQQNVEELYIACDYFTVVGLIEACCRFMGEHLSKDNCIDIWRITDTYCCTTVNGDAFHLTAQHFTEVCTSSEFLKLSVQQLLKLIEADQLLVKDESTVFMAILCWINHSPEERKTYISQILPRVRLALMTRDYFMTNVRNNKMVMCDTECQDTVKTAQTLLDGGIVSNPGIYHPLARPRLPASILFAVGGKPLNHGFDTNSIEAYDICTDRWVNVTNTEVHNSQQGAVFLNGSIYCVGGHDGYDYISSVKRFDLATHTWHQVAPMKARRGISSITVLNGRIYAIGGYIAHKNLITAECYDPETNQWMEIASMHERKSHASCTTFQGKVYIFGGYGVNWTTRSSAECYSPETNQWTPIAPMSTKRCGLGVVALGEQIYAVGGYNCRDTHLNSAEAYNPQTNSWHTVTPMLCPRKNFGIEVVDGRLFVIGGSDQLGCMSDVESYDLNTDVWSDVRSMRNRRSSLGCCVVSGLTNMADYAAPRDRNNWEALRWPKETKLQSY